MICYLKGTLFQKSANRAVIDVQGVGYEVGISNITYDKLPDTGTAINIHIYHHITDSDQTLYGFYDTTEKELFELLITVKNIGPKMGLAILSGMPASDIYEAILQKDTAALSTISGIGKKTAERICLELKDKIADIAPEFASSAGTGGSATGGLAEEAVSALESLGYQKKDATKAVKLATKNNDDIATVTDLVKKALAEFNR